MPDLRVAIVGYGLAGHYFHAPLIAATAGLEVAYVITSNRERAGEVRGEHPGAQVVGSVDELWGHEPQLVVVATPNQSHAPIARAALEHGVPVVVDKPIALSGAEAEALVGVAERQGVMLTAFHNRRWDTDQLTLRRLIAEGALGEVTRYESRFERWRPEPKPGSWREAAAPEAGGGVLLDLGPHLVDQALVLFGAIRQVYAEIAGRRGTPGDDDVFIALSHDSGTVSHLWASAVAPAPGPRLRVQGTGGGFLVPGLDPQEAALRAGGRPDRNADWGRPPDWEHGRLVAGEESVPVPPEPGDWPRFYSLLRDALHGDEPVPVDPHDAVTVLRVLEAARKSARLGGVVQL
jgi:predicted dehydrogenase